MIRFEWNPAKSTINLRKHGVDFGEAKSVFYDEFARVTDDIDHSNAEDRFVILGMSDVLRILIVCHCYRKDADIIRIISARKATSGERRAYQQHKP